MRQVSNISVIKSSVNSEALVKFRLWFYGVSYAHLVIIALKLLTIDFREAEDATLWKYQDYRWKLITAWCNLLTIPYMAICMYCDWRELKGEAGLYHVRLLNKFRLVCFTSILLPVTGFADSLFWCLWNKDPELLAPKGIHAIVPFWTQHSMHTVSFIVVALDLILVPRERPKNIRQGFVILNLFLGSYIYVCIQSILQGEYVYPVLKLLSVPKLLVLILFVFVAHYLFYFGQWTVVDIIWGTKKDKYVKKGLKKTEATLYGDLSSFLVETATRWTPILGLSKSQS